MRTNRIFLKLILKLIAMNCINVIYLATFCDADNDDDVDEL